MGAAGHRSLIRATAAIAAFLAVLVTTAAALAQTEPTFPALTGRIVDDAGIISSEARLRIEGKLAAHEAKSTDQLVIATVPSLQERAIEDYANRLFREWRLGQAKTNNGVLFLVAPKERKIRIEVGYGLEGALTDAISKIIIATAIAPKFKAGDFAGGIEAGADAILSVLAKDSDEWQRRAQLADTSDAAAFIIPAFFIFIFIVIVLVAVLSSRQNSRNARRWHRTRDGRWVALPGPSSGSTWGSGWSSGGSSGWSSGDSGGFSGGGGSSGGGGASGDW